MQALIISKDGQMKHYKNLKNDIPAVALQVGFVWLQMSGAAVAAAQHSHNKKPLYNS